MRMSVVLLVVLSVAVAACVALPYVERDEETELSQVSRSLVTLNGDIKIVLPTSDVTFAVYCLRESCL
jgi:predicted lysophospholipase L1 biosynthesis ABC-type transport system permease subunit